jgi:hypothetical protein
VAVAQPATDGAVITLDNDIQAEAAEVIPGTGRRAASEFLGRHAIDAVVPGPAGGLSGGGNLGVGEDDPGDAVVADGASW